MAALIGSACSGQITVASSSPSPPVTAKCRALLTRLPDRVAGQSAQSVQPADALAKAWGEPAIVLRCGVAKPAALRLTSACFRVNGVDWFVQEDGRPVNGTEPVTGVIVFTTVGRSPSVEVSVPPDYQPAADALVDVSSAVSSATTEQRPCM